MSALKQALCALEDPDADLRLQALAVLSELADPEALPEVVTCMQRDPDSRIQAAAAELARHLSAQLQDNPRDPFGQFRIS